MVFSSASTARAIRSRAPLRSSSWSGSLTSGVGDETASRVESVMAYPFLLVVIVLVINQQDTPLFQIAPYTRNEHSSCSFSYLLDKCTSRPHAGRVDSNARAVYVTHAQCVAPPRGARGLNPNI